MSGKHSKVRKKKKLGSYPYVSVVFSISLALFVIGLFGFLMIHTSHLTDSIRENVTMQIYLDKFANENDKIKINRILTSKPYIAVVDNKPQIEFISKEQAAEVFIKDTGEDFIEFLGDNPLRDAFNIKLNTSYQQLDSLKLIKAELTRISGVFEVVYVESLVESINNNLAKVGIILMSFSIILLITIVILINNTIKLALFSQRFLIRSMQLVGAKHGFIINPFVRRAALHGLIAGLLACLILYGLLNYANLKFTELKSLQRLEEILVLFGGIVVLGIIIGSMSTFKAVNKYLKMSLDELY
jgi:cell division transport system permease protein